MRALALVFAASVMAAGPCAAAAPSKPAITARIQRLEDIEQIRRLLTDYGRFLDKRDLVGYSQLFAEDGVWDGGFGAAKGPAAILAMMRKQIGGELNEQPQKNFHLLTNFEITVDRDTGTAWSRWTFVNQGPDGKAAVAYAGRYDDQLVREHGRWKFRLRHVSADLPGQPPPSGPLK